MKRFTCALTLLAAVLALLVLPSTAQAAEISFFRGKTAVVEFYSTDPTGCLVTSVTVFAYENRYFSPPAPHDNNAGADVTIHLFNTCTWEQMACGAGSFDLPDGAFNFNGFLASATLNATGKVHDFCTGTDRPITVALTWTGEGEIVSGRSHSSTHSPGYHVSYRQSGQQRDATVAGSMTLEGTPLSLGTGLGYFTKTNNGTITRSH
jgi:hypothetical protein